MIVKQRVRIPDAALAALARIVRYNLATNRLLLEDYPDEVAHFLINAGLCLKLIIPADREKEGQYARWGWRALDAGIAVVESGAQSVDILVEVHGGINYMVYTKFCERCGGEFSPAQKTSRFCPECVHAMNIERLAALAAAKRKHPPKPAVRTCQTCGQPTNKPRVRFCDPCGKAKEAEARKRADDKRKDIIRHCACGQQIVGQRTICRKCLSVKQAEGRKKKHAQRVAELTAKGQQ